MIRDKRVIFGLYVAVFTIFWNLLDFIYSAVIAGGSYAFSGGTDLGLPMGLAIITGYLFFLRNKTE